MGFEKFLEYTKIYSFRKFPWDSNATGSMSALRSMRVFFFNNGPVLSTFSTCYTYLGSNPSERHIDPLEVAVVNQRLLSPPTVASNSLFRERGSLRTELAPQICELLALHFVFFQRAKSI